MSYIVSYIFLIYHLLYRYIVVILAWILFIWAAYKVAQIKTDHVEYDPYEVLGVDRVSGNTGHKPSLLAAVINPFYTVLFN